MAAQNARSARPINCRKCGAECLRGEDDDRCALTVTVDIEPVDLVGEMVAIFDGLLTFDLVKSMGKTAKPGQHDLYQRDQWRIHSAKQPYPIHVQHVCKRGRHEDDSMPSLF